jgi:NAD-reducing hydrogenase large subunit
MKRITIDHVTRIEGHAKITLQLDEQGKVSQAQLHVTQLRGFEKFVEGRPYYEMPGITSRICGICPISHALASSKACDAIMSLRIPPVAQKLRELLHCAQIVQSHALSYFYLSAPDLMLGMEADPSIRNFIGLIEKQPERARDGIELRKFGLQVVEGLAQERVHASWVVPGGVNAPLNSGVRDRILADLPGAMVIAERTIGLFKKELDTFAEELAHYGTTPTMHCGTVDRKGGLRLYDGQLRFRDAEGKIVEDQVPVDDYGTYIGEASLRESYLKAPYFKPQGYPAGIYRVGALARINVVDKCGAPEANTELEEFRERFGRMPQSSFLYHYARLIEIIYALERIHELLDDPQILETHVRSHAGVNSLEGIGMIEAPRGTLIHHYKVNEDGAITWANLIVATGHNNLAIGKSIQEVAEHFVVGDHISEGMLNRISAVVRAYDPCFSCSTHATGLPAMRIKLLAADGSLLDELTTEA